MVAVVKTHPLGNISIFKKSTSDVSKYTFKPNTNTADKITHGCYHPRSYHNTLALTRSLITFRWR